MSNWPDCWEKPWIKYPRLKRATDFIASLVGIVLLFPLLLVIAVAIKTTSHGPVFYRGLRTGRFGKIFRIFKFRTMVVDAEKRGGTTTGKNDNRITSVGAKLRSSKIDELPQLFNVLLGDMSLVGPRPEVLEYTSKFTAAELVILAVRPGVTDLSSLHFIDLQSHVGEDNPDEVFREYILPVKNQLRVQYVTNQSFFGDLWIILQTIKKIVLPKKTDCEDDFKKTVMPVLERTISLVDGKAKTTRCGMGCWAVGGHGWGDVNDAKSIAAIKDAWEAGINHFDTADVYGLGHSEKILSEALSSYRHEALIATKFGVRIQPDGSSYRDLSRSYCQKAVDASLRRLKVDSIPLFYAHWPDEKTSIKELMDTMLDLKRTGKIQAIGLSNFSPMQVQEALRIGKVDVVQQQFSLLEYSSWHEWRDIGRKHSSKLVTWGCLGRGLLTGKYEKNSIFPKNDTRSQDKNFRGAVFEQNLSIAAKVQEIARIRDVSPAQVALRFVLDTPNVSTALFGAKTASQVKENIGALSWRLSESEYSSLVSAVEMNRTKCC